MKLDPATAQPTDYTKATRTLDGRRVLVWDDPESPFVRGNFMAGDTSTEYSWYREDGRLVNCPDFYTRSDLAPPSDAPEAQPEPKPQPTQQPDGPITAADCMRFMNRAQKHNMQMVLLIHAAHNPTPGSGHTLLSSMPKTWQAVNLIGDVLHTPHMLDIWETLEALRIHLPQRQAQARPQAAPETPTTNQA